MKRAFVPIVVGLLALCAAADASNRVPGKQWLMYASPQEAGFSAEKLAEARKYWESLPSAALMVVYDGAVVVAWGDVERRFMLHSARKSIMSGLYGVHVDSGRIDANKTLEELGIDDVRPPLNEQEKQARIIDLLRARSGVYHAAAAEPLQNSKPERGSYKPGEHWCYNNWDFNALGTIFEQETGTGIFEEFERRFARPLHMEDYRPRDGYYEHARDKSVHPSYPIRMSARDMARFGLLYLRKGSWNGRQILSANWVDESTRAHSDDAWGGEGYGYLWWISAKEPFKQLGMFSALGVGEQSIDVLPGADMVIVHRTDTYAQKQVTPPQRLKLIQILLDARVSAGKPDPELVPLPPAPEKWKPLRMSYSEKKALCGTVEVVPFGDTAQLVMDKTDLVLDGPMGRYGLIPVGDNRFILEDVGWPCRLETTESGSAERIILQP